MSSLLSEIVNWQEYAKNHPAREQRESGPGGQQRGDPANERSNAKRNKRGRRNRPVPHNHQSNAEQD